MTELNSGRISIGATAVMGIYFMTRAIGRFNKKYPGIEIDLKMGNSLSVVNMIMDGEVDLGFTGWTVEHPEFHEGPPGGEVASGEIGVLDSEDLRQAAE